MSRVKLAFVGDVMLGRQVSGWLREYGPDQMLGDVRPQLRRADAVFGNLEC